MSSMQWSAPVERVFIVALHDVFRVDSRKPCGEGKSESGVVKTPGVCPCCRQLQGDGETANSRRMPTAM